MHTIVSMTDKYGVTGNANFKDGRTPSNSDLLEVAKKYNLSEEVKVTITDPVKTKTRFVFNVVNNKIVKVTDKKVARTNLERALKARQEEILEQLAPFEGYNFNTPDVLDKINLKEEDVWKEVNNLRQTTWSLVSDKHLNAMFNKVVVDHATEVYGLI